MYGGHCLKTWSKTQALIAKSSGEAELYAVVKGAAEALGMATLAKDLGRKVEIQLHVDALAAKGMIERKGLSKVRHLDVNVLWLQEQCARKILPVSKVPGEENPADLMTKHLGAAKVQKNVVAMNMRFLGGRADKAAQLHHIDTRGGNGGGNGRQLWNFICDRFNDKKGGDKWRERGGDGIWSRVHTKPRRSLFTPYKVAKGPSKSESLSVIRFTKGVTQSGREFEFHDNWHESRNAHRMLDEQWVGFTVFVVEDKVSLLGVQENRLGGQQREGELPVRDAKLKWSEILAD
jgi:hypothetical protein